MEILRPLIVNMLDLRLVVAAGYLLVLVVVEYQLQVLGLNLQPAINKDVLTLT